MLISDTWRLLLDEGAQVLNLKVAEYCEPIKQAINPRYLHANTYSPENVSSLWRLKVVNPKRSDFIEIQECNRYHNCIHARLSKSRLLRSLIDLPEYMEIPADRLNDISCSEFVPGRVPQRDDLPMLADTLVMLRANRQSLLDELGQLQSLMPHPINLYNQQEYRNRLQLSIKGLSDKKLISVDDARKVMADFQQNLALPLPEEKLTFVHGDFSFANLQIQDNKLVLMDFEHSHIGIGEFDLAHIFMNLSESDRDADAAVLIDLYQEKCIEVGVEFDHMTFHALVLERVAGKMNYMPQTESRRLEKLKRLLLSNMKTTA